MIQVENLTKRYGAVIGVTNLAFRVEKGEVLGFLGPNGAGKTTTFSIVLGLVESDGGRVFLGEDDITDVPMYRRARRGISLLPQEPSSFRRLNVEANLVSVMARRAAAAGGRRARAAGMLRDFGIERLARAKTVTLSGGERRRLEIARALATEPSFMLLDEPFTGIDPIAIQDLQAIIRSMKERGLGVLITDHNVSETLRIVDRAYIIDRGRILEEGAPDRLLASDVVRRRYLGEEFRL